MGIGFLIRLQSQVVLPIFAKNERGTICAMDEAIENKEIFTPELDKASAYLSAQLAGCNEAIERCFKRQHRMAVESAANRHALDTGQCRRRRDAQADERHRIAPYGQDRTGGRPHPQKSENK